MIKNSKNSKKCGMSPYGCTRRIFITEPSGISAAENIFTAALKIIEEYPCVEIVCPEFKSNRLFEVAGNILGDRLKIEARVEDAPFEARIDESYMVVSDSPSVCAYAFATGKPTLVTLTSQTGALPLSARLVGTLQEPVFRAMRELLVNSALYYAMENSRLQWTTTCNF